MESSNHFENWNPHFWTGFVEQYNIHTNKSCIQYESIYIYIYIYIWPYLFCSLAREQLHDIGHLHPQHDRFWAMSRNGLSTKTLLWIKTDMAILVYIYIYIYIYAVQCPPFYWTRAWLVMRLSPEQDKETRAGATNKQGRKPLKVPFSRPWYI